MPRTQKTSQSIKLQQADDWQACSRQRCKHFAVALKSAKRMGSWESNPLPCGRQSVQWQLNNSKNVVGSLDAGYSTNVGKQQEQGKNKITNYFFSQFFT